MHGLLHSSHERLEIPEPLQQGLVCQILNVLVVVEGFVGIAPLVDLLEGFGLVRVDSLQDA